jgi:hypothetical protein
MVLHQLREDYENAIKNKDETGSLAILDFYKNLLCLIDHESDAFKIFEITITSIQLLVTIPFFE